MKELSSEIHVLLNSAAQNIVLAADEYIDPADGLIHCKSCGGQRQAVVPIPGSAECFTPRCLCPCQTLTEQHRRAAEEQRKRSASGAAASKAYKAVIYAITLSIMTTATIP